jgi:hypothetical protein
MIAGKTIRKTIKPVAKTVNRQNGQMTKQRNRRNCHWLYVPLCNRQINGLCNNIIAFGHRQLSNWKINRICVWKTIRIIIQVIIRITIQINRQLTALAAISITQ